jgi:hypothetical protein
VITTEFAVAVLASAKKYSRNFLAIMNSGPVKLRSNKKNTYEDAI